MENELFEKTKVSKAYMTLALPVVLGMVVSLIYNMVDTFFIAWTGNTALIAGVSLGTPIFTLMIALGDIFGVGGSSVISRLFGKKEYEDGRRISVFCFYAAIAVGIAVSIILLAAKQPILGLLGCDETTWQYAGDYYQWIALGAPFIILQLTPNNLLRTEGFAKASMIGTMLGAVVNIILDPIFIFGLQWGMMGAAIATVIGQVVTAILAVWYLLHMRIIKPESGDYALSPNIFGRMLTLGITSFLSQISLVAAMAAINNMLRKYGALDAVFSQEQYAQIPMAVVGIVMKFFQIVISIVVGMAAGCIPIVGYNMGAEKTMRVRELFTRLLISEALVGAVALILAEGFPHQLIAIFGASNESSYYTDFAVKAFRTYLCMMIFACVNKACFIFLQAVGKALTSTMLSMFREVVFGVGFALLLPVFFGLDGVLYSMPVSDILTFIISAVIIIKTYHELNVKGA